MSPARSTGPVIAAVELADLWIDIPAPMLGASLGVLAYELVRGEPTRAGEFAAEVATEGQTQ